MPDRTAVDDKTWLYEGPQTSLVSDITQIPENTGASVGFTLNAGTANAGRDYILLGSVTGTTPGIPLPGGMVILPINYDLFTALVIQLANSAFFPKFLHSLDNTGSGYAVFNCPPVPGNAGLKMYFAYALNNPWNYVSNYVEIEIIP